jgi:hypothetical protein
MLIWPDPTGLRYFEKMHKASQSRLSCFFKADERLKFDTSKPCAQMRLALFIRVHGIQAILTLRIFLLKSEPR